MEGGRSGRCPPVACEGSREQAKVRHDFVKGRERARAAWSAEAWSGSQRDSIGSFGGRYMAHERRAQAGQSSTQERAGLRVQCSSARAGGAPSMTTAPAARSRRRSAPAALLASGFVISLRSYFFRPRAPEAPCLQPHAGPGRKADLHFGRWHTGGTPGKERAACADAEISILMQHNAENK